MLSVKVSQNFEFFFIQLGRLLDVHHTLVIHKLWQQNLRSVQINFVTSILLLIGRKVHVQLYMEIVCDKDQTQYCNKK